jgi:hypothetical protein
MLTHNDLFKMNNLVNLDDGHIAGIVDWVDAEILPFGNALYGLHYFLRYMNAEGW